MLSPILEVFGQRLVQLAPEKGNFPLMGVEGKKAVWLDGWRFDGRVLPLTLQLLWYEGKPVPVVLP